MRGPELAYRRQDDMTPPEAPIQLSLVLACYNEAEHIQVSVPEIIKVLDASRWSYEIIFVDDVSRDNTRELIQALVEQHPNRRLSAIFHAENTGRGGAVSDGFRAAVGEFVGYIDIDLEVHARYISSCILALEDGADVCVAHRIYRLRPKALMRHVLSRGYAWLARQMLGVPYNDTESGYKFLKREVALVLLQHTHDQGWFWDSEIMFYTHRLGYKVVEIPALFLRREDKTSTVKPLRDSIAYWRSLTRFVRRVRMNEQQIRDGRQALTSTSDDQGAG
jgi:glycosyltransferase involved in cell wall biosynthesis